MFKRLKLKIELRCIRVLTVSGSAISARDVNMKRKTVFGDLYGIGFCFLDPKQKLALAILMKWYGYKPIELKYEIRSTGLF